MSDTTTSTFTFVPEAIAASAAELSVLSRGAGRLSEVDLGLLPSLVDVPFIGQFCHAVTSALTSQRSNVAALSEYGAGAASALTRVLKAVIEADHFVAGELERLGSEPNAADRSALSPTHGATGPSALAKGA